jgi:hypothetical protein
MAIIERFGVEPSGPAEKSGPEKYAPPARRASEAVSDDDHTAFQRRNGSRLEATYP